MRLSYKCHHANGVWSKEMANILVELECLLAGIKIERKYKPQFIDEIIAFPGAFSFFPSNNQWLWLII